jgi:hypothetical protein
MTNDHSERTHAPLGGSSAYRWTNCPGSIFYIKNLPPTLPGPAAIKGTDIHEIGEKCVKDFLTHKLDGTPIPEPSPDIDKDYLEVALQYRDIIWQKVLRESLTGKAFALEDRLVIHDHLGMYGYLDFWVIYTTERAKRRGVVVDLKTGVHPVPVDKNPQLAFYAVALREEIRRGGKDLDEVEGVIIQPALEEPHASTLFTGKQLDIWHKRFFKAAESIFVRNKPKFAVGDWCKFCPAKAVCKAYSKEINTKTSLALAEPEEMTLPRPEMLSDEQILKLVTHASSLKDYIDSVIDYAKNRYVGGNPVAGTKLVQGNGRRKWDLHEFKGIVECLKLNGICEPTEEVLLGITVIEKQLVRLIGKERATQLMDTLTTKPPGPVSLVLDNDPRPPLQSAMTLLDAAIESESN